MTVQDIDRGYRRIMLDIAELKRRSVGVGVHDDAGTYPDGTPVSEAAILNEFGYPPDNIPARPFTRTAFDRNQAVIFSQIELLAGSMLDGATKPNSVISQFGNWYQQVARDTLTIGPWAANSKLTIRRKGSSQPLIDTRLLVSKILWKEPVK